MNCLGSEQLIKSARVQRPMSNHASGVAGVKR